MFCSQVTVGSGLSSLKAPQQRRSLGDTINAPKPLRVASPLTPKRRSCSATPVPPLRGNRTPRVSSNPQKGSSPKTDELGPRGSPDGAESSPADPFAQWNALQAAAGDPLEALEERYHEIRTAVASMERQVDERNLQALKEAVLPGRAPLHVSSSELVHEAYERTKAQTRRSLEPSPSESLSRRLGRELRIRRRREEEHRVIRSPSERRIGTIRRRSKELEIQQQQQQQQEAAATVSTPKLKPQLLLQGPHSPQASALRRGKPNSLRSGLPLVVNAPGATPAAPLAKGLSCPPAKTVCVSKRRSASAALTPDPLRTAGSPSPRGGPPRPSVQTPFCIRAKDESSRMEKYEFGEPPPAGCTLLLGSSGMDLSGADASEWVPATEFLRGPCTPFRIAPPPPRSVEAAGNRPSIAALTRQRKVTANVRLFSQLEDHPPSSGERQTPRGGRQVPLKPSSSDLATPPLRPSSRRLSRRFLDEAPSPRHSGGVVSPLRERNALFHTPTPKIKGVGVAKTRKRDGIKAPYNSTPLPPRPYKPPTLGLTPRAPTPKLEASPPKLPPRTVGYCP